VSVQLSEGKQRVSKTTVRACLIRKKKKIMNEDSKEKLGIAIDRVSNIEAALQIPMPPAFHIEQFKKLLPEIVKDLRDAYAELTGEDPWEFHPDR